MTDGDVRDALEARGIAAGEGQLTSEAISEIGLDGKILVIQRIHVHDHLKIDPTKRETAERVLDFHKDNCPVVRSIGGCVAISTSLEFDVARDGGSLTCETN